jgi:hypothetical protein
MFKLVLFRFNGHLTALKLKNRVTSFFPIFVCILLFSGCDNKPPEPMPYQTTPNEDIVLVNLDYSVSRFWGCGWRGGCQEKRWDYCLHVVPKNADAALKWYRIYHRDDLERAAWERSSRRDKNHKANSPAIESVPVSSMSDLDRDEMTQKLKLENFIEQLDLIERGDPTFKHQLLIDMKAGIHLTAWYSISKVGKPDESKFGWSLSPNCYL